VLQSVAASRSLQNSGASSRRIRSVAEEEGNPSHSNLTTQSETSGRTPEERPTLRTVYLMARAFLTCQRCLAKGPAANPGLFPLFCASLQKRSTKRMAPDHTVLEQWYHYEEIAMHF